MTQSAPKPPPAEARKIREIVARDGRYREAAYVFTVEALDYSLDRARKAGGAKNVDGRTLLDGIRAYALQSFGYLSAAVFRAWGVRETSDFGEIVFHLIEAGLVKSQETDTKDDFVGVYDFADAFETRFVVEGA